ncbi:Lipopolysaccharide export system ATP-binding protein LptB [archaeon HR03]|uniref:Branched-chain amino acid ABC transporter ATP-binding protein n=1 Tax=Caldiarchaeum subterraneum TaxID=311458 RepID=E6N366_CALS0|nr:branched-chain amino acid transport system ATP-binding protein [Candidatus Caldarchaeum subterraneum]BAJ49623.1 branched-chain amino acid ABC transporter ATP-binding protein [Candidatus Caldarchaeum subterraneum]GBC72399.1 Lipopolysaccharide export system ATP-binding protein LptB [archaeon HR03]
MDALVLEGISKNFGALAALTNVNMRVQMGEVVGLIGPNGAGKTTLFNIVTGFIKPDRGRVKLFGEDVTGLQPHQIAARGVARTFQIVKPFLGMTVYETVLVGAYLRERNEDNARQRAEEAMKLTGVYHLRDRYARELNTPQLKLVELARSLATQPKLLMLDEIVAGLTPAEVDSMTALVKRIRDEMGVTVLLVEHVMRFVMNISDRVVVLNYGEVIAEGSPSEVSSNLKVIEAYLGGKTGS